MRKLLKSMLCLLVAFCIVSPMTAFADTGGSGNVDGGGGGMGGGTSTNSWNPGNDGVRVTVVRASDGVVVTTPIDFTNKTPTNVRMSFGNVSKITYATGRLLVPSGASYSFVNPAQPMPRVVSTNGSNNIEAIKKYFCSEYIVKRIAEITGMNYEVLIGGQYKILLEPLAFYKFEGIMTATTATEAALLDEQNGGLLRKRMVSLSHKNLPLAMFLETADLGYPAWSGSTTSAASNANIKSSLGLGIVRFKDAPTQPPTVDAYDYIYRVNTEVITSVRVSGGQSDPDNPTRVSFNIGGKNYDVGNVYYPDGDSQLAWVRWTTPDTAQDMVINVSVSGPGSTVKTTINAKIVDLDKNPPPNPVADDRNDGFHIPNLPIAEQDSSAQWGVWRPWWQEYWVWHSGDEDDSGYWCDHGWWEFDFDRYEAYLRSISRIKTDEKNPTASGSVMKSGYGVNMEITTEVYTSQSSATTGTQTAVAYFSEFNFETYWRLMDRTKDGYSAEFQFKKNPYSTYKRRTHFTPIWYPDGAYSVYTELMDCWTPDGMLSQNESQSLTVRGNLWQDWHAGPLKPK